MATGGSKPSPTCGGTADILPEERSLCSFDVDKLRSFFVGKKTEATVDSFRHLFSGPPFNDVDMDDFLGYQELAEKRHHRAAAAMKVVRDNPKFMVAHQAGKAHMGNYVASSGVSIHFSMFLTFVRTQASKEQQDAWLDHAINGNFLGAYAQTELGHGSNIRALETTATFDKETDEFVIDSPTLTSMKWWPTGIQACTHACVMAQLVIEGVSYGFHGFFVQLRDDKGYCMPGVEIGEIGPKFDPAHNFIGYARFHDVRVPRFNLFAKNQQVTREGQYIPAPPKLSKFKYISMMATRVAFVGMSADSLAKSATIATRYACVRTQGFTDTQAVNSLALGENRVIEYQNQQYRAFRAIGLSYMFAFTARWIRDYLMNVQKEVSSGNISAADDLPELHASCAGLKVWGTLYAHDAMEDMRRSCGGQGFLRSSALGDIMSEFGVAVTGEGEQVILSLQVARYLIKAVGEHRAGKTLAGTVAYLDEKPLAGKANFAPGTDQSQRLDTLLALFKDRARRFSLNLERRFSNARASGKSFDEALNSVAVVAYKASETHCVYVFVSKFLQAIPEYIKDAATCAALHRLAELVLSQLVREHAGDWAEALDYEQQDLLQESIEELLKQVRPDCIGLVDAFGITDEGLKNSTLGRYDGNVYEAIYARAKQSPLNAEGKPMVAWEHFSQVLDLDFLREGMQTQRVLDRDAQASLSPGGSGLVATPTVSKL